MKRILWLAIFFPTFLWAQAQGPYGIFGGPIASASLAPAAHVPANTYAFTTDMGLMIDNGSSWVQVTGSSWTGSPASPPAIGGTTPNTGAFTIMTSPSAGTLQVAAQINASGAGANNSFNISSAVGVASSGGANLCQIWADTNHSLWYNSLLTVGNSGDFFYCSGAGNPGYTFYMQNNTNGGYANLDIIDSMAGGAALTTSTPASTSCTSVLAPILPTPPSAPCTVLIPDIGEIGKYLMLLDSFGTQALQIFENSTVAYIGDTTPVKWIGATSTGTSQATVTVGDTNASSTIKIQAGSGGVSLAGVSTGTNADFLCLSSGGVVLLQASACTISSRRFKTDIRPLHSDALGEIAHLDVDTFKIKAKNRDPNGNADQIGLIAEDVAKIEPRCAIYENDMRTPKSYRQECVIAMLVRGEQELIAQNQELQRELRRRRR